ncbi:AAA domain-containing protein [Xanthomonas sp. 10-10]|uniref:AAA domain-containing protein n=1 Tax=Xanthomonas sp. 10-10 TaxID=3115848 RepID=A0AAU7P8H6_9XANT
MSASDMPAVPGGSFATVIQAQAGAAFSTDDVVLMVLPLFQQVADLHAHGKVAALDTRSILLGQEGGLQLAQPQGQAPVMDIGAIHRVQPHPASALNIVGELRRSHDANGMEDLALMEVQDDLAAPIERPVYLPAFASWELQLGHHDEITDVFRLGLVLAALACGLDLGDVDDVRSFAAHRRNLFVIAERLHPVVAAVIVEMTALNRHERATDVASLATRLRTWRDQPEVLDVQRALAGASGAVPRRTAVLSHLRDRLFDLSRRNRLLYFKPTASSVNLTVSSVPLMLQVESIQPDHICTWSGPFANDLVSGRAVDLQRWLRFDDQPYLPVALDKLIQDTRRDRAEYGFGTLRLVAAFLRWHNLKEDPEERIVTPLLWLPVELTRRKGVRDRYVLQAEDDEAEFNPVLRHQLRQLYDIRLPEKVDLQKTSLAEIHADLLAQIRRSEPSVELRLVDKPQIRLVRQKALQRLQQFQRRRSLARTAATTGGLPDYSYAPDNYRPLGRALYEQRVVPSPLPQRFEAGAAPVAGPRHARMAAPVEEVADRVGYALGESEGHRYAWDLDLTQVSLANFNYKKMSLVRDYAQLIDAPDANPAFDRVFSIEPRAADPAAAAPLPTRAQWNVVDADATQNAAVALARTRHSFIIQGPPGTGKSQTITNLIADYAGEGKRVLFVCEKRAALDVVFHRLKQSGLDPLCCLIHDSQTDKKAFIAELGEGYARWIAQAHGREALMAQRDRLVELIDGSQQRIDVFEQAMSRIPEAIGTTARQLVRQLIELPAAPALDGQAWERLPDLAVWERHRALAARIHAQMQTRFGVQGLAEHPLGRLHADVLADPRAHARITQLLDDSEALLAQLDPLLESGSSLLDADMSLAQARAFADQAQWLVTQGLAAHLDLLDDDSPAASDLRTLRAALDQKTAVLNTAQQATAHWRDRLDPADARAALALVEQLEGSVLRWVKPAWWRLRGELVRRYDFGRHAVHPGYTAVLRALVAEQTAAAAVQTEQAAGQARYGVARLQDLIDAVAQLRERLGASAATRTLVAHLRAAIAPLALARADADARGPLERLASRIEEHLELPREASLESISEYLRDLRECLDELADLLPLLRSVHAADAGSAFVMRNVAAAPAGMDAIVAHAAWRRLEADTPALAGFDGAMLARAAATVAQGQARLLALNSQVIQATQHQRFAEHVRQSSLSASQLDQDGKAFKKLYATGRRELEHEFAKSMRHRSIRDLSDDETGMVINDLKPIWLMSPLSVSDTLPLSPDLFDVVIFDEASQIPTEEAVPALSRARQIVVVGDEMQLPPTSFFSSAGDGTDALVVEDDGERIAINLDADSLLNQAARNLPATLLAWHYRSRHEALISFSNAAFYDGRLVTIPDRRIEPADEQPATLRSDRPDAGIAGADAVLARAVSFHRLDDGVYIGRRNAAEARYIALTVRELLRRETGLSMGIVAFSEAQQGEIESALEILAAEDADFALRLDREYVREDDDQFNGLFVKNLENVQGDERDVILLSICYAPGPDGRMLMNFGPINQRGGEKRLNVIFSRARHRMAVVSSIQAEAITNVHNDGAAALQAFLRFAQASAIGDHGRAQHVLGTLNAGAREAFVRPASADAVRSALARALRERGHLVHECVGRSQFRCDLAIVDRSTGDYRLAILLDAPDQAVADTRERYVFRPGVLRRFGWNVIDVPGRDWLRAPDGVLVRIETALAGENIEEDAELDLALDDMLQASLPIAPTDSAALLPTPTQPATSAPSQPPMADALRSLRFEQGSSRKFWRVARNGTELSVSFGRIGTTGQTTLKAFDTVERATREMDKLTAEKLRKGYVEDADPAVP